LCATAELPVAAVPAKVDATGNFVVAHKVRSYMDNFKVVMG
jgi:hypothetical protein